MSGPYNAYPVAPFTVPALADFDTSLSALTGTTVTGDTEGIIQQDQSNGVALRFTYQAPPTAPYTITAGIDFFTSQSSVGRAGIAVRNSATGRMVVHAAGLGAGFAVTTRARWTNLTTFSLALGSDYSVSGNRLNWFRIINSGTVLSFQESCNGLDWITFVTTETIATFITTIDQIGFFTRAGSATTYLRVASWEVS